MSKIQYGKEYVDVARVIIEKELAASGKIARLYLVAQLQTDVLPWELYNVALEAGTAGADAIENMRLGAAEIAKSVLRQYAYEYAADDCWITRKKRRVYENNGLRVICNRPDLDIDGIRKIIDELVASRSNSDERL